MRKVFIFTLSVLILFILHFSSPKAFAEIILTTSPDPLCQDKEKYTLTFDGPDGTFLAGQRYTVGLWGPGEDPNDIRKMHTITDWENPADTKTRTTVDTYILGAFNTFGRWYYKLWFGFVSTGLPPKEPAKAEGYYVMLPKETCALGFPVLEMDSPVRVTTKATITVRNINPDSDYLIWFLDGQVFNDGKLPPNSIGPDKYLDKNTSAEVNIKTASLPVTLDNNPGRKTLCLKHGRTNFIGIGRDNCEIPIYPIEVTSDIPQNVTTVKSGELGASLKDFTRFKEPTYPKIPPPCAEGCFDTTTNECTCIDTAIGIIDTDPAKFVQRIFSLVLGLAGGIALILIIISGYKFMTSQGNPEKVKSATEGLTSAIVGLLFIIFAFVILQIVGVDILKIPGFE
ncbi:MAG: hypothetical protein HW400_843 [Candidatus Levybacteria bacterium]|nr:hypothetical protein [Candidatus Levybacteria bacterium]